jgi:hypothetical protein
MADTPVTMKLLELAASRFDTISPAEQKLFDAAADGKDADCMCLLEKDRIIRGDRLLWLCTNPDASVQVTYRGVSVLGAKIDGEVNLEWAKISFPLKIRQCEFTEGINLQNSHLASFDLADTSIKDLRAEQLVVERNVALNGRFKCEGRVDLSGATIGGDLLCDGEFIGQGAVPALDANGARIQGQVSLGLKDLGGVEVVLGTNVGDLK